LIFKQNEIKNSKKTRGNFKSFGQNRSKKFEVLRGRKFIEVESSKITRFSQKPLDFLKTERFFSKPERFLSKPVTSTSFS
jgi:hypothetical protein